jgi:hypothetical protein
MTYYDTFPLKTYQRSTLCSFCGTTLFVHSFLIFLQYIVMLYIGIQNYTFKNQKIIKIQVLRKINHTYTIRIVILN